jgi:16S rRNA (cytosine1402-N4)-methyltransferase
LKNQLRFYGVNKIDGLLADLGISSHQIDAGERGFSTRYNAPLDMRMDRNAELTAKEVVNTYSGEKLAEILSQYGELKNAGRIAKSIVKFRTNKPVETTFDLIEAVRPHIPKKIEHKFLARIFQAVRIEVNGELESLKRLLQQSADVIKPGGRLAVITYHSLEDRLVKRFIQSGNFEGEIEKDFYGNYYTPFKKVGKFIVPSGEEIARNPRARSAKLRVAERNPEKAEQ